MSESLPVYNSSQTADSRGVYIKDPNHGDECGVHVELPPILFIDSKQQLLRRVVRSCQVTNTRFTWGLS
jgi:hypothetical protein